MASFWNIASRFRQAPPKGPTSRNPSPGAQPPTSPGNTSSLQTPASGPQPPQSPSLAASHPPEPVPMNSNPEAQVPRKPPFFFREENSNLIVKGNFMTLAAKPEHVEKGEWLAHQVVEQYRLLEGMIKVIQETDQKSALPICNPKCCPTMTAAEYTYTWLDNQRNPIRIPASQYISLVQRWILGKIMDQRIFVTDSNIRPNLNPPQLSEEYWLGKGSGFPKTFENDITSLYRQMFRCYAHIYHGHWLEPFYHLGIYKELNTCFIHFINVGRLYNLLHEKDMKPMQPLIDIWEAKNLLPSGPSAAAPANAAGSSQAQPMPATA